MSERAPAATTAGKFVGVVPEKVDEIDASGREGVCWSAKTDDFNLNVVAWSPGKGVPVHVNDGADVLLVAFRGQGRVTIDQREEAFIAGSTLIIPRGVRRSVVAETRLVYLTCHRRQPELFQLPGTKA